MEISGYLVFEASIAHLVDPFVELLAELDLLLLGQYDLVLRLSAQPASHEPAQPATAGLVLLRLQSLELGGEVRGICSLQRSGECAYRFLLRGGLLRRLRWLLLAGLRLCGRLHR